MAQLIAGESPLWLVTTPLPLPLPATLTVYLGIELPEKVALAVLDAPILTLQVGAVPLQAPPHVLKRLPGSGVAVRVTTVR